MGWGLRGLDLGLGLDKKLSGFGDYGLETMDAALTGAGVTRDEPLTLALMVNRWSGPGEDAIHMLTFLFQCDSNRYI